MKIDELLKRLTDPQFGPIQARLDTIQDQIKLNIRRIEALDDLLDAKRQRLERQFTSLELALPRIQDQIVSLISLQSLASAAASRVNSSTNR